MSVLRTPDPLPADAPVATGVAHRPTRSSRALAVVGALAAATLAAGVVVSMPASGAPAPALTTLYMSTSTKPVTDAQGTVWAPMSGFVGGRLITPPAPGTVIKGADTNQLYMSSMFLMTGWSAPVTNGTYTVTLKMVDTWYGTARNRVFSVTAEGAPALTDVDIAGAVGQFAAYDRSFTVTVSDGRLDLGWAASRSSATVSALSVVPAATPAPTTPAPTTPAPTTPAPTTPAPTTPAPTTPAPTTPAPTTPAPTTPAPTTPAPTTPAPANPVPTQGSGWLDYGGMAGVPSPTTPAPTTPAPTTPAPTTPAPTTPAPTTPAPTTPAPTTPAPASRPGPTNTGVPAGTILTRKDGFTILDVAGATYQNLDIHGRVRIMAPNITLKNSIIRGDDSQRIGSVIDVNNPGANHDGFVLMDSEIVPEFPQWQQDGILGHDYTVIRSNIHGTTDAVKVAGDNVTVRDSWLHDTTYFVIPGVGYGDTHNDGVQSVGGTNLTIVNNTIEGNKNSAVMLGQDQGLIRNVTITGNYLDDGACSINFATKGKGTLGPLTIQGNTFGMDQTNRGCAIIGGAIASTVMAPITGNVWSNGTTVAMSRGN